MSTVFGALANRFLCSESYDFLVAVSDYRAFAALGGTGPGLQHMLFLDICKVGREWGRKASVGGWVGRWVGGMGEERGLGLGSGLASGLGLVLELGSGVGLGLGLGLGIGVRTGIENWG